MKILKREPRDGIIKLKADTLDDIWILSRIIDKTDLVSGETTRAVKKSDDQEAKRIKMFVTLEVQKTEFTKNLIRILGTIVESSNPDVSHGSFHTITVEPGNSITIKKQWQKWQIERIHDAVESTKKPKLILCAADYGDAAIALLKEFGIEYVTDLSKTIPGKKKEADKIYDKSREDFLVELARLLEETANNKKVERIVFGGVGFLSENFTKILDKFQSLKKKISIFKISSSGKNGINELIKSGAVEKVVKNSRISDETMIIEKFFAEVAREGLATYGIKEVENAVTYGAVETLLVSDNYIEKLKEENNFDELNKLMESAENSGAKVMIISQEHESGERFAEMQVAAILRYKI